MSIANKLLRGSAISLVDQAMKIVVMFITTPLMVRHLGEHDYGLWLVAMAVIGYLQLLDLGVSFSGTRFLGQAIGSGNADHYNESIQTLNYLFNRIALATVAITLLLSLVLPAWLAPDSLIGQVRWVLLALGLAIAVRFLTRIFEVVLKSHLRYDLLGFIAIVKTVVQGFCLVYFLSHGYGLKALLAIFIFTDLIDRSLLYYFSRSVDRETRLAIVLKKPGQLSPFLRYSASAMMASLGQHLRNGVDPLIIGHFSGLHLVPVYSIGARFLSLFTDVINAIFGGNFVAAFSQLDGRNDREGLVRNFLKTTRFSSAFAALGGGAIALFGPSFIDRWIGSSFVDSGSVLLILVAPTCLMLAQYPVWGFFYSQNKQHWLAIVTLAGGAFNAVLSVILALKIGFFGVVWATFVEFLLVFGMVVPWLISRICGGSLFQFWTHLLRHSLPFVAFAVGFYFLLGPQVVPDYLRLILLAIAYGALSLPLLLIVTFAPEDRELLFSRFRRRQQ